jgi:hypothetical protein
MTPTFSASERTVRIQKIRILPVSLRAAVAGLAGDRLDTPYREGGWTVRQVVHHLADSHMHAFVRMKLILAEDHPTLKPYDQDIWARMPDTREAPLAPSLAILEGLHERWTLMLERIPEREWSRTGFHPERGEITLESLLNTYAGHGEKHVSQITGLRTARGW